ncbi:hypothetical protein BDK51DRAFT_47690, partial [Blyttiomyces helicus]
MPVAPNRPEHEASGLPPTTLSKSEKTNANQKPLIFDPSAASFPSATCPAAGTPGAAPEAKCRSSAFSKFQSGQNKEAVSMAHSEVEGGGEGAVPQTGLTAPFEELGCVLLDGSPRDSPQNRRGANVDIEPVWEPGEVGSGRIWTPRPMYPVDPRPCSKAWQREWPGTGRSALPGALRQPPGDAVLLAVLCLTHHPALLSLKPLAALLPVAFLPAPLVLPPLLPLPPPTTLLCRRVPSFELGRLPAGVLQSVLETLEVLPGPHVDGLADATALGRLEGEYHAGAPAEGPFEADFLAEEVADLEEKEDFDEEGA